MNPLATRLLRYTNSDGERVEIDLDDLPTPATVGRTADSAIFLGWDSEVSRLHCVLERLGTEWTVSDDGISRNGTFVNGERLAGRQRLFRGDRIRVGSVVIEYLEFDVAAVLETRSATMSLPTLGSLSETQRKVLVALCRPYQNGLPFATPATNQQIADELFLSVDSVKSSLRVLSDKFGVGDLPQNQKRLRLAVLALHNGIVGQKDY